MNIPTLPHLNKWQENEPISKVSSPEIDPASNKGPAVVQFPDGDLYAFYKGASSNNIYYMTMDADGNWSGNQPVQVDGTTLTTDKAPAATIFQGDIYLVYKKDGGSNHVKVAKFDGTTWYWGNSIDTLSNGDIDPSTSHNPAAAVLNDVLYIAYSGNGTDRMYLCWYNGTTWDGNKKIESNGNQLRCDEGPALAPYNGLLYLCWQGNVSQELYQATWDGEGNPAKDWENYDNIKASRGVKDQPRTNKYPTLVPFDGKLFLWYKGNHSDKIYQMFLKDQAWKENVTINSLSDKDIQSDEAVGAGTYTPPNSRKEQVVMVYKSKSSTDLYEAKFY